MSLYPEKAAASTPCARFPATGRCGRSSRLDEAARVAEIGGLVNNAKFIIQVSRGLIRDPRARRVVMFYSVLIALVLLFSGATFLWPFLRDHPFIFIGYWAACGWITILAALLALYDLVKVRAEARRVRRQIESDYLKTKDDENPR